MKELNRAIESSGLWMTTETAIRSCGRRPNKVTFSVILAVYWCRQCQRWSRPRVVLFPWLRRSTQLTEVSGEELLSEFAHPTSDTPAGGVDIQISAFFLDSPARFLRSGDERVRPTDIDPASLPLMVFRNISQFRWEIYTLPSSTRQEFAQFQSISHGLQKR